VCEADENIVLFLSLPLPLCQPPMLMLIRHKIPHSVDIEHTVQTIPSVFFFASVILFAGLSLTLLPAPNHSSYLGHPLRYPASNPHVTVSNAPVTKATTQRHAPLSNNQQKKFSAERPPYNTIRPAPAPTPLADQTPATNPKITEVLAITSRGAPYE